MRERISFLDTASWLKAMLKAPSSVAAACRPVPPAPLERARARARALSQFCSTQSTINSRVKSALLLGSLTEARLVRT